MTPEEQVTNLNGQLLDLTNICRAALAALPRNPDPNLQPPIRQLPEEVNKVVDLFVQIASTTELPAGKTIYDLPLHVAKLFGELKSLRQLKANLSLPPK